MQGSTWIGFGAGINDLNCFGKIIYPLVCVCFLCLLRCLNGKSMTIGKGVKEYSAMLLVFKDERSVKRSARCSTLFRGQWQCTWESHTCARDGLWLYVFYWGFVPNRRGFHFSVFLGPWDVPLSRRFTMLTPRHLWRQCVLDELRQFSWEPGSWWSSCYGVLWLNEQIWVLIKGDTRKRVRLRVCHKHVFCRVSQPVIIFYLVLNFGMRLIWVFVSSPYSVIFLVLSWTRHLKRCWCLVITTRIGQIT